jgi:hypothetical protein
VLNKVLPWLVPKPALFSMMQQVFGSSKPYSLVLAEVKKGGSVMRSWLAMAVGAALAVAAALSRRGALA